MSAYNRQLTWTEPIVWQQVEPCTDLIITSLNITASQQHKVYIRSRHKSQWHACVNKIYRLLVISSLNRFKLNRFKPHVWQKQAFACRNPTLISRQKIVFDRLPAIGRLLSTDDWPTDNEFMPYQCTLLVTLLRYTLALFVINVNHKCYKCINTDCRQCQLFSICRSFK